MNSRLSLLWLGLLLSGCDKPGDSRDTDTSAAPATPASRRGHALRAPVAGSPEELRAKLVKASAIKSPAEREKAFAELAWNALEIDPGLACEALLQLPSNSPEKLRLIQHQAMRLAEKNPEEALAWAATVGSEEEVAAAFGHIALELAETDPSRAATLLSESGIVGHDFDVAVVQVLQRWAAKSASDAAAWVSTFPPSAAREAGVREIASKWLPEDPQASFAWLSSMKDPGMRQETARAMEGIILQQPEEIREAWLRHADAGIREEIEQQRSPALLDVGDNVPTPSE